MNNKIVYVGDVHGRTEWVKLLRDAAPFKKCVFLGDYVDSFDKSLTPLKQADNLAHILEIKKADPKNITLLVGNHDLQYFDPDNEIYRCSGFSHKAKYLYADLFRSHRDLFDIAHIDSSRRLITHAGLTEWWLQVWLSATSIKDPNNMTITELFIDPANRYFHENHKKLIEVIGLVGKKRGGYNPTGGPLWADKREMELASIQGIDQIVGHTQVERMYNYITEGGDTIYFCDTGLQDITVFDDVMFEELPVRSQIPRLG